MRLFAFARLLLEKGIGHACPVRGAISHGEVAWGRLTYGKAVLDAHRLEVSQDWIGFSLCPWIATDRLDVELGPSGRLSGAQEGRGNIQLAPVLVWNVPALQQLANRTTSEGLYQEGELLPWKWQQKLIQTVLFAKYIEHGSLEITAPQSEHRFCIYNASRPVERHRLVIPAVNDPWQAGRYSGHGKPDTSGRAWRRAGAHHAPSPSPDHGRPRPGRPSGGSAWRVQHRGAAGR